MARYRLLVEYDGRPYAGWQSQAGQVAVQDAIERALRAFCGESLRLKAAGRTDAGVHAFGQVAHVDLSRAWPEDKVRDALNAHLSLRDERVSILEARRVPETFDARLSAIRRHYLYRILNRRPPPAIEAGRVWHVKAPLDAEAMAQAAKLLLGKHDFTTFRAIDCQAKSPLKTLEQLDVARVGAYVEVRAAARSFLHRQVRSMVGSLERVGAGRWSAEDLRAALEARDRARCGPVAPAGGLYFMAVDYAPGADGTVELPGPGK